MNWKLNKELFNNWLENNIVQLDVEDEWDWTIMMRQTYKPSLLTVLSFVLYGDFDDFSEKRQIFNDFADNGFVEIDQKFDFPPVPVILTQTENEVFDKLIKEVSETKEEQWAKVKADLLEI